MTSYNPYDSRLSSHSSDAEFAFPKATGSILFKLLTLFLLLYFLPVKGISQDIGFHKWLVESGVQKIVIEVDWDSLLNNKKTDKEWDASILLISALDDTTTLKAELSVRGKYRRRICDIPPIEIDIKKKSLRKHGFDDRIDEFKLVTHCQNNYRRIELVEKEATIYRLYNTLTEISFHAIEIDAEYRNRDGKRVSEGRAIILESPKELAQRNGLVKFEGFGMKDSISTAEVTRIALFQCLVANHDWDIDMLKNIKLFKSKQGEVYAVPYDFDFSGWVGAPYWAGRSDLKLLDPMDRYLFLDAVENSILEEEWKRFEAARPEMERIIADQDGLSRSQKRAWMAALEKFFTYYSEIRKGERRFPHSQ